MSCYILSLSVILSVLCCQNIQAMHRLAKDPQLIRCNENDRRAVRIVSNTGDNLTVSGAVINCQSHNDGYKAIMTCCHGSYDKIYGVLNSPTQILEYRLDSSNLFDLHSDSGRYGLSDDYYRFANEYMGVVKSSSLAYGRYAIDTIFNPIDRLLMCNITTQNPVCWRVSNYVKTIRPRDLHLPVDIAMIFAKSEQAIPAKTTNLPEVNYTSSLKGQVVDVVVYGNPSNELYEYKFTIPCVLSSNGQWLCSVPYVTSGFANTTCGMSGGPCFINDREFCGVVSGYASGRSELEMRLYIKTIPDEFINLVNSWR